MKNAVIRAINDGYNMYPHRLPGALDRLTRAIVSWEKKMNNVTYRERDIIPTQGISGGIRLAFSSILKPGDEILLTDPTYPSYIRGVKENGGKAVFFKKIEEEDWSPDLDELRKVITNRTKGLVLIHPNNPTGALYDGKTMKEIADIVGEYDFPLISDEIYGFFVFNGAHFKSLPLVAGDVPCLRLDEKRDLVSDVGNSHQQLNVGVFPGHASELLRQQQNLAAQGSHKPQVAVHRLQSQAP